MSVVINFYCFLTNWLFHFLTYSLVVSHSNFSTLVQFQRHLELSFKGPVEEQDSPSTLIVQKLKRMSCSIDLPQNILTFVFTNYHHSSHLAMTLT